MAKGLLDVISNDPPFKENASTIYNGNATVNINGVSLEITSFYQMNVFEDVG